jgi:hypothetical protein
VPRARIKAWLRYWRSLAWWQGLSRSEILAAWRKLKFILNMSLLRNTSLSFLAAALLVFLGWFTGSAVGWLVDHEQRGAGAFVGLVGFMPPRRS